MSHPVDVAAAGHNIDELEEQHGAIAVVSSP
jgi:hypothetical protein